jgi:hypothetical protein
MQHLYSLMLNFSYRVPVIYISFALEIPTEYNTKCNTIQYISKFILGHTFPRNNFKGKKDCFLIMNQKK